MNKKSNWCQYLPGLMIAVFAAGLSMVLGKAVLSLDLVYLPSYVVSC